MVATLRKVNPNEWAVNDRPNQMFCYYCFFNTDCLVCMRLRGVNQSLTDNKESIDYVVNDLIVNLKIRSERMEQTKAFLLDEVSIILDKREENDKKDKKKVKKSKRPGRVLRTRSPKIKKKADDGRKRTRKRKAKKDMAIYA